MSRQVAIDENNAGRRADIIATRIFPRLSRAYIHKLFEAGKIKLNGGEAKPGHKLKAGDRLSIDFDEAEIGKIEPIELPVIYEDDDVIVIDKPAGVISHSRGKYWNEPSVASFVRQRTGQKGDRAGIVHRLDRATSGVMVCAKNKNALAQLQKQFSLRIAKKTYLALVAGHCHPSQAIIDIPIERNPKAPSTFRAGASGKQATTSYRVLKSGINNDLIELQPTTGRTHQLRIHIQYVGHPILGDTLYGGPKAERLMLHAHTLEITLPSGVRQTFISPMPKAFNESY